MKNKTLSQKTKLEWNYLSRVTPKKLYSSIPLKFEEGLKINWMETKNGK